MSCVIMHFHIYTNSAFPVGYRHITQCCNCNILALTLHIVCTVVIRCLRAVANVSPNVVLLLRAGRILLQRGISINYGAAARCKNE